MKLKSPFLIKPHTRVHLSKCKTDETDGYKSADDVIPVVAKHRDRLESLQEVLYAGEQKALLIVLQGMDTAGKDGTIRQIFSGINPQGCNVASFKVPSPLEARHDFLWRCHFQVPPRGMIGIFNRSHYEDVLSPVVHGVLDRKTAEEHLEQINDWERMLVDNGVTILKFFLNISKGEQHKRLQARLDTPDKHWKLSEADFKERAFWDDYQNAYEEILSTTSHKHAPWFVIPSDKKWFRNVAISQILVDAMGSMDLKYPKATFDPSTVKLDGFETQPSGKRAKEKTAKPGTKAKSATP